MPQSDEPILAGDESLRSRYQMLEPIGTGGFGHVYKARQIATGQIVAIKALALHDEAAAQVAKRISRFRREMEVCARLHHPNIVRLIDSGQVGERGLYTVFEFVPGQNLAEVLRSGEALGLAETRHLMMQVLDALACAHAMGVVHRDLKPPNIMITTTGARRNAMVLDFGIGAVLGDGPTRLGPLTEPYEILGTPAYAAPEQLRGEPPTLRADLYAWGLVFLECLTGRCVMAGADLTQVLRKQLGPEPVPIPPHLHVHGLGAVLYAATRKAVAERDVTAAGLLRALEQTCRCFTSPGPFGVP